jgi:phosphoglycerate dehydrogenase-like enzyme
MSDSKPLVLIADPSPRTIPMMFAPLQWERLQGLARVAVHDQEHPLPPAELAAALAEASAIIGQIALPAERLRGCPNLRTVFNVEGNFLPNVDYDYCFGNGIRVLNISPVFSLAVAELGLGMALGAARNMFWADRSFRDGSERWGADSSQGCFLLTGSTVGIIGLGDIGTHLRRLLEPFKCRVQAYDPWLPGSVVREHGCEPVLLEQLLETSQVIFVVAGVTSGNIGFLGRAELERVRPGSVVLLLSRAAVVDFDAFRELAAAGRFRAGTDVFPEEPVAADDPIRRIDGMILSGHRAGGPASVYQDIGRMVNDDLELVLRGLPPRVCKRAEPETVKLMRGKPVAGTPA